MLRDESESAKDRCEQMQADNAKVKEDYEKVCCNCQKPASAALCSALHAGWTPDATRYRVYSMA